MTERFDESYWREQSHYRKYQDYRAALLATQKWYAGLLRLIGDRLPPPGRHLDAGCGHGAVVHLMAERGFDAYGVDASDWVIDEARRFAPTFADRFAVADVSRSLAFEGPFDLITSLEVVEHLDDPRAALARMAEALAPGGLLVLSTPNPVNRVPRNDPSTSDPTHVSLHPPGWWTSLLEEHGLRAERVLTYYPVPMLWRISPRLAWWIPLGRTSGPGYLAVARSDR
jgi:2-polyprenyl-3-methyl-5-hydroxy-6-metoxy-1,4-benzoquinol methylase